ncbi:MAG: hypothetical protein AMJ43_01435 [Coxiella sp. DG_40]|nr:MAG: hypothetical protein AMJ43_01435 [Coxiella sp. DG_40]
MNNRAVVKNRSVSLTPQQRKNKVPICLEQAPGIIIHPSFCCPQIMKQSDPLTSYLLGTKVLMLDYFPKALKNSALPPLDQIPEKGGEWICGRINRMLHVRSWEQVKHQPKNYKQITQQEKPWFPTNKEAGKNIICTFLTQIGEDTENGDTTTDKVILKDSNENIIGKLRTSTIQFYAENGYKYLFRVEIRNHNLESNKLYDLCWIILDEQACWENSPDSDNHINPLLDIQDTLIRKAVSEYRAPQKNAYKINQNQISVDESNPIQSYHPVYITDKKTLKIGHLTDIHISSRHFVFKNNKNKAQLIMNNSQNIADMVHSSHQSTEELIQQIQQQNIDILMITGDFQDYSRNIDPNSVDIKNTGSIWTELNLNRIRDSERINKTHPYGIDDTLVFSLIKKFYDDYQKPIYLVTGNHDSYEYPYGISPRLGTLRANEGIPGDHNLTISEAILMFGPGYKDILKETKAITPEQVGNFRTWFGDFTPWCSDWFYHVFTPLSDFVIHRDKQTLIGLGWGDEEGLLEPDFFPVAEYALTNLQMKLIANAQKHNKQCLIFMHPTIVSYQGDYPLSKQGKIESKPNTYSLGTFKKLRPEFFKNYLFSNKKYYILSGHSHRSGLYEINTDMTTKGYSLESATGQLKKFGDKTRIIVTGSSGPIPVQNLNGEMQGYGWDIPTATIIDFSNGETIKVLKANNETAKPRFAVAMDYYDLIGNGVFHGKDTTSASYLSTDKLSQEQTLYDFDLDLDKKGFISSKDDPYTFTAKLDDGLPDVRFIEKITFYGYKGDKQFFKVSSEITAIDKTIQLIFNPFEFNNCMLKAIEQVIFLSIKFNNNLLNIPGFKQYNFDSSWEIRIQVDKRINGGYRIRRHATHGEIPNFRWYNEEFPNEYPYDKDLPK